MKKISVLRKLYPIFTVFILILIFSTLPSFAADKVFYYHTDATGTPMAMTDSSGNVVWQADYKPFGEEHTVSGSVENKNRFVGKEKDEETDLYYFGARYLDARSGRFIKPDPVGLVDENTGKVNETHLLNPQKVNRYVYAINNPYRYIDPDGREVTIAIQREKYSNASVTGTIKVTSDVTTSTFKGYSLENAHAGDNHDKKPIPEGTYDAKVRTDRNPNRVELKDVPGYENIQIHTGNTPDNLKGCIAPGTTRDNDRVGDSKNAMGQINKIIREDGTNKIRVTVIGPSTRPIK